MQKLDQLSFGEMVCRVSKDGTVFDNLKSGYLVVSSAAKGTVFLENPKRKLYFNCSESGGTVKKRFGFMLYRQLSMPFVPPKKWERERSTIFRGHPVTIYRGVVSPSKGLFDGVEFWVAQDIPIPPQTAQFNKQIHGWPVVNNLPVRVIRFEPGKGQKILLETNSITPIFIPANTFELPKNYKEAKEEQEVTNVDDGNLKGLIDNWTGGETFK